VWHYSICEAIRGGSPASRTSAENAARRMRWLEVASAWPRLIRPDQILVPDRKIGGGIGANVHVWPRGSAWRYELVFPKAENSMLQRCRSGTPPLISCDAALRRYRYVR